jgi:hypothetical protein
MSKEIPDTSVDYDDMVGYVAAENAVQSITAALDIEDEEYQPTYLTKNVDPEFPESWQTCLVSLNTKEDYFLLMEKLNKAPYPIKKQLTFEVNEPAGVLSFLE